MCSVQCGVWSVECDVWNVECEVWSPECEVTLGSDRCARFVVQSSTGKCFVQDLLYKVVLVCARFAVSSSNVRYCVDGL